MTKAWSVSLTRSLPTGAAIQLKSPEPGLIRFLAPWDGSPQPLWFHFRAEGTLDRRLRFELGNPDACLGGPGHYRDFKVQPVYTFDAFDLAPSQQAWHRVPKENLSYEKGVYGFEIDGSGERITVAHSYPYGLRDLDLRLATHGGDARFARDGIGRSGEGREIPRLRIAEGDGKPVIWVLGRQHAAEVGGAWGLDGFLQWLFSDEEAARRFLERFQLRVFPMVDIDGVENGYYGKERGPLDFNRSWLADSPRPEIRAIMEEMCDPRFHGALFLDFHSPCAGDCNQFFLPVPGALAEPAKKFGEALGSALAAALPARCLLRAEDITVPAYMGPDHAVCGSGFASTVLGLPTATPEISYGHLAGGAVMLREDYLEYGAVFGRTLAGLAHTLPISQVGRGILVPLGSRAKPTPEYAGKAFLGCYPWSAPRHARIETAVLAGREALIVELENDLAEVDLALPAVALERNPASEAHKGSGEGSSVDVVDSIAIPLEIDGTAPRMIASLFGLAENGARLSWKAQAKVEAGPGTPLSDFSIEFHAPARAHAIQVSLRLQGGPCRLRIGAPAGKERRNGASLESAAAGAAGL